jgi:hypothetical protein
MLKDAFVTRRVRRVITGEESAQAGVVPVLLEARQPLFADAVRIGEGVAKSYA